MGKKIITTWKKKRNEKRLQSADRTDGVAMKCKGLHQGMSSVVLCAGTGSPWCTSNSIMKLQNMEETALNCATGTTL